MSDRRLDDARTLYARMMAAVSRSADPRIEQVFASVAREDFLPPGPWHVMAGRRYVETPSADPALLYQDVLVALDSERGINNGEPSLHAGWIGAVAPKPGETVTQVGTGLGYYTAILSLLVRDGGRVVGIEIDKELAAASRRNLADFDNAEIVAGDAVTLALPQSDIIYVNAGVVAPPLSWLEALKPSGRMIFPWRPADDVGIAVLATRATGGFAIRPIGGAWFISCVGASDRTLSEKTPGRREALQSRSIVSRRLAEPDDTATAVYPDLWFSTRELPAS